MHRTPLYVNKPLLFPTRSNEVLADTFSCELADDALFIWVNAFLALYAQTFASFFKRSYESNFFLDFLDAINIKSKLKVRLRDPRLVNFTRGDGKSSHLLHEQKNASY